MPLKAEVLERPPDVIGRLLQLLPVGLRRVFFVGIYREGHGPVDGPDVDVGVGNLKPRYREPDLLRFEALLDGLADGLGDGHEVCGQLGAEVDPMACLFFGDDERVARGEGGMFRKATHPGSRQTKQAGTSPSMMRVNTVAKRRSSFRDQYSLAAPPDAPRLR
jgi:hypothetical protein